MPKKPFLTAEHKKYIQENRLKISSVKMAEHLGCSRSVVQKYMRNNGLTVPKEISNKFRAEANGGRTTFTAEMDAFLIKNYLKIPVKPLGEMIGKSGTGVNVRLRQLGLEIPKEIREERKKIGQLKTGCVPPNKGKKQHEYMSPEAIARTAKTRFKKGHKPHNTAEEDGVISIRKDSDTNIPYKYIRVSVGNWQLYQRYVWEKANGPIPEDHCIRFKDGNALNCRLENLELINRAENLNRNWHNYPKPLKRAIKLTNKIKKQL